jgi:hypothetical protein
MRHSCQHTNVTRYVLSLPATIPTLLVRQPVCKLSAHSGATRLRSDSIHSNVFILNCGDSPSVSPP